MPDDYEAPLKYAAFHLDWAAMFDFYPDEVAASLTRAILKYVKNGTVPDLEGVAGAQFNSWREQIDADLERNRKINFKREQREQHNGERRARRASAQEGSEDGPESTENGADLGEYKGERKNETINDKDKSKTINDKTETLPLREGAQGGGGSEVNLSDYLTEEEQERLFEGAGNYEPGFLERFVLSPYYCRGDSLYQKSEKAIKLRDEENAKMYAEKEAAEKERAAAEDAKSVEGIKEALKAKARTLSGYSNGQRPRDLEELHSFCKALGCSDFPAVLLWKEMEFHGWEIQDGDAWRPVKSWKGFVIHRIAVEECEG